MQQTAKSQKSSPGKTTLPHKVSLKHHEVFAIGKIIESLSEPVVGGRAYKLGQSDETAAEIVLEQLKLAIEPQAIVKVRKRLLGIFVTDKGKISDKVCALQLEVAALRKQVVEQGRLLAGLRSDIEALRKTERPQAPARRDQPGERYNGSHP